MQSTIKDNNRRHKDLGWPVSPGLLLALLVAFLAAWPLISEPGLLNTRGGGDSPFLLQRLNQLEQALRDGHFPARWMGDANYGLGYPFFNFYAPLSLYIAAVFRFLGFTTIRAIESAQLLGFIAAAAGMFLLARRWFGDEWAAFLASVAYTTAPFHLVNIYVRGDSLAEFWAMAFYPWVILAADRLLVQRDQEIPFAAIAALSAVYAALILSHNISALVFTPFLLLFIVLRLFRRPRHLPDEGTSGRQIAHILWPIAAAGLLALGLAAWFFVPALADQPLASLGPVTEGYFSFANHFRGVDLVQYSPLFDYDVGAGGAFRMGLVQLLLVLAGAASLAYFGRRRGAPDPTVILFALLTLVIATLMITPLSRFLWDNVPLLPFTQFPWRFLSIQAFAGALAIGALALWPGGRAIAVVAAVILILSSFAGLRTDHLLIDDEAITAGALAEYEWFSGNIGSTVSAEYLPPTVVPRVFTSAWLNEDRRANVLALRGQIARAKQLENSTDGQTWIIDTGQSGATISFATIAWPGWTAAIDGKQTTISHAVGSGRIAFDVPPGEHTVTLQLGRTSVHLAAELISLAALAALLFLLVKARRRPRPDNPLLWIAAGLLLFSAVFRFWPETEPGSSPLTWDFAQMAYLHHDLGGVPFDNGARLLGYDYDSDTVAAGQDVTITLMFSGAEGDMIAVDLASPAQAWPGVQPQPAPIAAQDARLDSSPLALTLHVPESAPAMLVAPRLTLAGGRPLTPSGQTRGDLYLRPLRITRADTAQTAQRGLDVKALEVAPRDESTLDVLLAWTTGETLSQNYNASLILVDGHGEWLSQLDTQPGYGFLPSSEWEPGKPVTDRLALALPAERPQGSPAALAVRLYEVGTGRVVLTRRLGEVRFEDGEVSFSPVEPQYALPEGVVPMPAVFEDAVALLGYTLSQQEDGAWLLTLYWQAAALLDDDIQRFVHIFNAEDEAIVFQVDGHPQVNTYPISQWMEGEIVADGVLLEPGNQAGEELRIGVGFYRPDVDNLPRLAAVDQETGQIYPENRVVLPQSISAEPNETE